MNDLNHLAIATEDISFDKMLKNSNLKDFCTFALKEKIKTLSIYTKSQENCDLDSFEKDFFINENICFKFICDKIKIPQALHVKLKELENKTALNKKLDFILCIDYDAKKSLNETINNLEEDKISQEAIDTNIDNKTLPPIDLLIRTGGIERLSGMPTWQCAYAEFCFTKTTWENFTCKELDEMIKKYTKTHRRFGGL